MAVACDKDSRLTRNRVLTNSNQFSNCLRNELQALAQALISPRRKPLKWMSLLERVERAEEASLGQQQLLIGRSSTFGGGTKNTCIRLLRVTSLAMMKWTMGMRKEDWNPVNRHINKHIFWPNKSLVNGKIELLANATKVNISIYYE